MKKVLMFMMLGMVFMSGCALSTLSSANTVRPGDVSIFAAGMGIATDLGGSVESTSIPGMDLGVRFGISDNIDMGIRPFLLGMYADLKWALFQSRKIGPSVAVDGGIGYSSIGGVSFYSADIGPIVSFKIWKIANPYISAKYRSIGAFGGDTSSTSSSSIEFGDVINGNFLTLTGGIEFLPDSVVTPVVEVTQFYSTEGDVAPGLFVYNFGIKINF